MSINITLLIVSGILMACGVYLLLERSLTRVLLGIVLAGNGANLLLLTTGGAPGLAPIYESGVDSTEYSDPLPQALVLTAIVITFAVTAFVLALIYRGWVLARQDDVADDPEDIRVAEQPHFDYEEDAEVPIETTEFAKLSETVINHPAEAEETPGIARVKSDASTESANEAENESANGANGGDKR